MKQGNYVHKSCHKQGFKYLETFCKGEEHHTSRPLHSEDFAGAEATPPPCWVLGFDFHWFIGTLVSVSRKISGCKIVWYSLICK